MKQLTCVILISLFIGAAAATPAQAGHRIELGPILSFNASKFVGDDRDYVFHNETWSSLNTTTGGAFLRLSLNKSLSVMPQVIYSKKGCQFAHIEQNNNTMSCYEAIVRLDYIEIPLLLRLRPQINTNLNPFITVGPSVAFVTSADAEYIFTEMTSTSEIITESHQLDRLDIYNVADLQLGMIVGIGLDVRLGRYGFAVEGRLAGSLSNAFTDISGFDEIPDGQDALVHVDGEASQLKNVTASLMFSLSYALEI